MEISEDWGDNTKWEDEPEYENQMGVEETTESNYTNKKYSNYNNKPNKKANFMFVNRVRTGQCCGRGDVIYIENKMSKRSRIKCISSCYKKGYFCNICGSLNRKYTKDLSVYVVDATLERGNFCKSILAVKRRGEPHVSHYICEEEGDENGMCELCNKIRVEKFRVEFNIFFDKD